MQSVVLDIRVRLWVQLLGELRGFPACGSPAVWTTATSHTQSRTAEGVQACSLQTGPKTIDSEASVTGGEGGREGWMAELQHSDEEELCLSMVDLSRHNRAEIM